MFIRGSFLFLAWLLLGCVLPRIEVTIPGQYTATPAVLPSPTTLPEPIELTRAAGGLSVLQHTHYTDSQGRIHVVGVVANHGDSNQHLIKVQAHFLDAARFPVAEAERYAFGSVLRPGDKTPFEITLQDPLASVQTYRLVVTGRETDTPVLGGIEIVQFHVQQAGDHTQAIVGEVHNTSSLYTTPLIAGIAYSPKGSVVDVGITYPRPNPVRPGETIPFKLYFDGIYGTVTEHELIASAREATQTAIDGRADLEIGSTHSYVDRWDRLTVVGLVHNGSATNVATIGVTIAFYEASGTLRAVETGYAWHDVLAPGRNSPFQLFFYGDRAGIDHWSLWLHGYQTDKVPQEGLIVEELLREDQPEGTTILSGQVANQGPMALTSIRIVAIGYDDRQIRTVGRSSIDGTVVPGDAAAFEIELPTEEATTFRVEVQGSVIE